MGLGVAYRAGVSWSLACPGGTYPHVLRWRQLAHKAASHVLPCTLARYPLQTNLLGIGFLFLQQAMRSQGYSPARIFI
jgi:hypothetical protein